MKKLLPLLSIVALLTVLTGCNADPLEGIRRVARSSNIKDKEKAAGYYKKATDLLIEAYASEGGLNKEIGRRLIYNKNPQFRNAIKHLTIAKDIISTDAEIYFLLGLAHTNMYRIEDLPEDIFAAKRYYEAALRLTPDNKEYLYAYAQLLVFGVENYPKAVEVLEKYLSLFKLNTKGERKMAIQGYFLLGRSYYMLDMDDKAYQIYNDALEYKDDMTSKELTSLYKFIEQTGAIVNE